MMLLWNKPVVHPHTHSLIRNLAVVAPQQHSLAGHGHPSSVQLQDIKTFLGVTKALICPWNLEKVEDRITPRYSQLHAINMVMQMEGNQH